MKLADYRSQYPQYNDMSDAELASALHRKFYSDIPEADFHAAIEFAPSAAQPVKKEPRGITAGLVGKAQSHGATGTWEEGSAGQIEAGNIDLTKRPKVKNADGSISTVRSMSFNDGQGEVLVPTVSDDGRILTDDQAIEQYRKTGQHLGKFNTPQAATAYAEQLHLDQEKMYADKPKSLGSVTDGKDGVAGGKNSPEVSAVLKRAINMERAADTLKPGAKIGTPLEVGWNRGIAGVRRIGAGITQAAADLTGSDTLTESARAQRERADEIENAAVLSGRPIEGFSRESIVQELPEASANALASTMQTAPAIAAGALAPGAALPTIFATSSAQEYGEGRDAGLSAGKAALRAPLMGALEVIGEKIGGTRRIAEALNKVGRKNGVATLAKTLLESSAKEIPGELVTTTGQILVDMLPEIGLNQDVTLDDYKKAVKDTVLATALQSGGMALTGKTLQAVSSVAAIKRLEQDGGLTRGQALQAVREIDKQFAQAQEAKPDTLTERIKAEQTNAVNPGAVDTAAMDQAIEQEAINEITGSATEALPAADVLGEENEQQTDSSLLAEQDGQPSTADRIGGPGDGVLADAGNVATPELDAAEQAIQGEQRDLLDGVASGEPNAAVADRLKGDTIDGEWTAFSDKSGTLKVPRAEMPQIKAEHRGALVNFLNARGVQHTQEDVPAASLKPTQAEFSQAKVDKASKRESGNRSILVSADGHVLDGHHQWMAAVEKGEDVPVIRLDAPIQQLLQDVREFPSVEQSEGSSESGSPTVKDSLTTQPTTEESSVVAQSDAGNQASAVTPIIDRLVKRRAAAVEIQKRADFDTALATAKRLADGKVVKPSTFSRLQKSFAGKDQQLSEIMGELHAIAKEPAKAERRSKKERVEQLREDIQAAVDAGDQRAVGRLLKEAQADTRLTDNDLESLDRIAEAVQEESVDLTDEEQAALDDALALAEQVLGADEVTRIDAEVAGRMQGMAVADIERELTRVLNEQVSTGEVRAEPGQERGGEETEKPAARKSKEGDPGSGEQDQPAEVIQDFGEKLHGAKKDLWASYRDSLGEAATLDIQDVPLSKSWPEPDYQKLLDGGADSNVVAFVHAARDQIPTKPQQAYKLAKWTRNVEVLRDFSLSLLNGDVTFAEVKQQAADNNLLQDVLDGAELYERVGHANSLKGVGITEGHYSIFEGVKYDPPKTIWTIDKRAKATALSNWPRILSKGDTREQAIKAFEKAYASLEIQEPAKREVSFDIYSKRGQPGFYIGKKVGKNYIDLEFFKDLKEARAYKQDHHNDLVAKLEKSKEIPNERRDTNQPRVGEDFRQGMDVTPEQFSEAFGFRGVQFGNWVEGRRRQEDLNEAYDALMDMAALLQIPPKAISLNGELGLAFGARGSGGRNSAKAHYEPDQVVINLTKKAGAGSLGHEWWHALDNYFSRMRNRSGDFMTEAGDVASVSAGRSATEKSSVRPEMVQAYGELVRAIRQTAIKARSSRLDAKRTKDYWTTGAEMSARAFESYLIAKLQDQNASNDYLANIIDEVTWKTSESLGIDLEDSYPYPTAGEIPVIRAAFDNLFNTIESRETDQGVALFSRSRQTETPEFKKWFGDSKVVDSEGKPLVVYHGTASDFSEFLPSKDGMFGPGIYLTADPTYANAAANSAHNNEFNGRGKKDAAPHVMPVYAAIKNPFDTTTTQQPDMLTSEWVKQLKIEGYDGIKAWDQWVAFYPEQIKSATGNRGTFDPANPDIRMSRGQQQVGMALQDAQAVIDSIRDSYPNVPDVQVVSTAQEIPQVQQMIDNALAEAKTGDIGALARLSRLTVDDIEGAYANGKVYLVASGIANEKRLREVFAHEAVGHMAIENMLDQVNPGLFPKYLRQVQLLDKAGNAYIRELAATVDSRQPELNADTRAREIIALIAERGDHLRDMPGAVRSLWQKIIDGIKAFAKLVFDVRLSDRDARDIVGMAERYARGEDVGSLISRDKILLSRMNREPGTRDTILTAAMEYLARDPELFQRPTTESKDIYEIAAELDPGYSVDRMGPSMMKEKHKNATRAWEVFVPGSNVRSGEIYTDGNEVWIDVSRLQSGQDRGSAIYDIAAAFAHNTGKVLVGDPLGLSRLAYYRRNENMLSSALKYGTTKHLRPSVYQTDPTDHYIGHEAEWAKSVRPLKWKDGDDAHNIKELIYNSYDAAIKNMPELKDVIYNPESRQFEYVDGRPFTGEDRERIAAELSRSSRPYRAGSSTIARAALFNTFLRSEGREGRRPLLGRMVTELQRDGLGNTALKKIMYSRQSPNGWQSPDESKLDSVIYTLQDKNIDLKRVQQNIKAAGKEIEDRWDAYLQEELYHGRSAKRTQDFIHQELDPLIADMRARAVTMAEFEEYLWMRHAEERNLQIAKINDTMPDGGSGKTTQEARDYLAALSPAKKTAFEALAKRVDAINKKSRQILIDYGLESAETIKAWEKAYKHYVPLMREDMDNGGGMGTGQGYSIKGSSAKRATGSNRGVVDILANIAQQRERNIIRGEKNRVATALIGLAKLNPNTDFWTTDNPPKRQVVIPAKTTYEVHYHGSKVEEFTNQAAANQFIRYHGKQGMTVTPVKVPERVESQVDPTYKTKPNVIVARVPQPNGEIAEHAVIFNEHNERAMRMAQSIKNLDQDQLHRVLGWMSQVTRYFSSINTQYNVIFGMVNFTRDVQGAALNLSTTELAGKATEILRNTPSALRGIYRDLRGKPSKNQWASLWEEFRSEGAQTGYRDQYRNAKVRSEALEHALDPEWWASSKAGKLISANGLLQKPEQLLLDKAVKPVFEWLSHYNEAIENSVRLSAYKTGLELGMSKQRAASVAKNLTVNFNRKGALGRELGAMYAFFNAAIQGTARIAETLTGPRGKQIAMGGIALGVLQAVVLEMAGFEDDEPPEFVRDKNLIIPTGNGKFISVPMPLGFNALPSIGRIVMEQVLSDRPEPAKAVLHMLEMLLDVTNPVGGSGNLANIIMPTFGDPIVDLARNRDFSDREIARQDFSSLSPTPGHTRAKNTASAFGQLLSESFNTITGGTDYKPGWFSPTPDQIDYLAGQLTGGVGREAMKVQQTAMAAANDDLGDLPLHKWPVVGRFYGDAKGPASVSSAFYRNIELLNIHENEVKGRRRNRGDVQGYFKEFPEARLIGLGNASYTQVQKLRKQLQAKQESGAPKEEIKRIESLIQKQMIRLNERVKQKRSAKEQEAA